MATPGEPHARDPPTDEENPGVYQFECIFEGLSMPVISRHFAPRAMISVNHPRFPPAGFQSNPKVA
jgi:hypothetical protein